MEAVVWILILIWFIVWGDVGVVIHVRFFFLLGGDGADGTLVEPFVHDNGTLEVGFGLMVSSFKVVERCFEGFLLFYFWIEILFMPVF